MYQEALIPSSDSPFVFQNHPIRTVSVDNALWFVAKDVCAALDIAWTGATLANIPTEWATMLNLNMVKHNRKVKCITEPAVYKLAFRSNKPEADAFTNWVASEVIPAIRNTGKFESPAVQPALPDTVTPSTAADRRPLDKLVKVWAQQSGTVHAQAWTQVNAHFNLDSVAQLPVEWIPDAIAFVEGKINALATIEAKPEPALCSVRPDSTIMDDIRAFADEVEQARQKNIEMQQYLFNLISKLMARIGIQYIGKYDTPDAVGFAVNGVYYVRESCRQAVMETHRPMSFCGPAALMAEFAGMIGGEYKKAAKQYTGVM